MLRIAVQSKGRLFEDTMALFAEADIKLSTSKRTLLTQSSNFPIEVLFLRDDDIPQSVASGVADLGIVGENEFVERKEKLISFTDWDSVNADCRWQSIKKKNITDHHGSTGRKLPHHIPAFYKLISTNKG